MKNSKQVWAALIILNCFNDLELFQWFWLVSMIWIACLQVNISATEKLLEEMKKVLEPTVRTTVLEINSLQYSG